MCRDPITRELLALIAGMSTRFHDEYSGAAQAQHLTGVQARLLSAVADGAVPMNRLASVLRCEPSNVTGMVDRLAARGLVTRRTGAADRRIKLVAAAGAELSGGVWARLDYAAEPLAALSDQERLTLRDLLQRIQDRPAASAPSTA